MEREEEIFARKLHAALTRELVLPDQPDEVQVSVTGGGVHWECIATRGRRSCKVQCFADKWGPEYDLRFKDNRDDDDVAAHGRTRETPSVIAAVRDWISELSVAEMHQRYAFVDRIERAFRSIIGETARLRPELLSTTSQELRNRYGECRDLWFLAQDRACHLYFYHGEASPRAEFEWDECPIFQFTASDIPMLAAVLARWLCERVLPSAIAAEFPSIEMSDVARYYEEGRPIEGEFIVSWKCIDRLYREDFPQLEQVPEFLHQLRAAGFDKTLRAGQSMTTLIVSRSRRHGMRSGQPSIAFRFGQCGMTVVARLGILEKFSVDRVELTARIHGLLKRLEAMSID
jgi:hypothetical protein